MLVSRNINEVNKQYNRMGLKSHIRKDFKKFIGLAILIEPGRKQGFFIMDVDKQHGGISTFKILNKFFGPFNTPTVKTPHGGRHIYFAYPINNSITTIIGVQPGIDILSDGSIAGAPPSKGFLGNYKWVISPDLPLMKVPKGMMRYIQPHKNN